ncbi:MAG: hypothetical protein PHE56_05515 [Bacteroidales bacterium]|nr:hypothetical protein [Bacteroidales bacterium]
MIITIDAGLNLARYDLCENTPDNWDARNHANCTEYSNLDGIHNKNKESFYFFFDNKHTCDDLANLGCKKKKLSQYWLTETKTKMQIKIIDFSHCKCIHDVLEIIDVLNMDVYNNSMKLNGLKNGENVRDFSELKYHTRSRRIFNHCPELIEVSWFGQLLTDFDNGTYFKKILKGLNLDGYRWCENFNPYSLTYCLLDDTKLDSLQKERLPVSD